MADDANLPAAVTRLLTESLLPGQTLSTEATGEDGRTLSCNVSVIVSATGERLGRVATIRDDSVLKGLETSKAQFIARVSRDLRRPLTLIRGYATMLPMVGELNERQREFVASIVQGVEQTGEMVQGLLNLGELGVGGGADRAPVRLAPLVIDAVEGAREQAAEGGVFLRVGTVERSTGVMGDAALLRQAVAVLLDNAIADTAPGGAVRVELMVADATATIRVEDGGTGGDAVGEPTASLGLATVRSIVDQHGGELRVETEPGAGSTYIISLPTSQMKPASMQGTMA
jgi:signal transduction histidine kinase